MRKVAILFAAAVILPSLVLAWLAARSLQDQQFVLERQQALLSQGVVDAAALRITTALSEQQRAFATLVEREFLARPAQGRDISNFHQWARDTWKFAEIGFVVSRSGIIRSPSPTDGPVATAFLSANADFLANREEAAVYWNAASSFDATEVLKNLKSPVEQQAVRAPAKKPSKKEYAQVPSKTRTVEPQSKLLQAEPAPDLKTTIAEGEFQQLIAGETDGMLARFIGNKLKLLVWHRQSDEASLIYGAQLNLPAILNTLTPLLDLDNAAANELCVALLDENAKPVAVSIPGFSADWKRPFVATEIGDALPHYEVAAYLLHPEKLTAAARTSRITLGMLVLVLLAAITSGSWLIISDIRREVRLARQKTDFVSNVSHELKTPLTSIRLFSELLVNGKAADPEKQKSFLQIIATESARLTRLINNVLDFARMERGEKHYENEPVDLAEIIRTTVEQYRHQLEEAGLQVNVSNLVQELWVQGDRDALAQVVLNLLSNAEKYAADGKMLLLELERTADHAELRVKDRGHGVPRGCETRIFEQFYRAHDALASGIQGSGLGLALSRHIARAHKGDLLYQPHHGGGSCFILRLPLPS
jgi:signal transduction histidine kinase